MKKILLSSMLVCAAFGLNAATQTIDGLKYQLNDNGTAAVLQDNYVGDIVVPSAVPYNGTEYTVNAINSYAFSSKEVTSIVIPNTVETIGFAMCMSNTSLKLVKLGSGVKSLGTFVFNGCSALEEMYCYATKVPSVMAINAFQKLSTTLVVYVPAESVEAYKADEKWGTLNIQPMPIEEIAVTGITLDQNEYTGEEGDTFTLTATVAPEDATDKTVAWTSSDEAVATVDENGLVTLVAEGTATITATCAGFTATCTVTVEKATVMVESITLDKAEYAGKPGTTLQLTATVLPEDATDKTVDWFSSDEAIATVDENGLVTLVAEGTATITASPVANDGLSATCKITVSKNVGIESIEAENGAAEYFNMQGMRVANPEKGQMVIVRKGGKAVKAVL